MTAAGAHRRRLPLRARVTLSLALLALAATTVVSVATYFLARSYLLDQRELLAQRQAFLNARLAKSLLLGDNPVPEEVLGAVGAEAGSQVLLLVDGRWYASAVSLDPSELPASLRDATEAGAAAMQRFTPRDVTNLAIGIPIPAANAVYVEVTPLREMERTLNVLATSLAVASAITTVGGAVVGLLVSSWLLRPLHRIGEVAVDIAEGDRAERLDAEGDADLESLVLSFNHMVDALQERIDRETRFASDVSHELRTPLTALATSVEVVRSRAADATPRLRAAVDVLGDQVRYFERLVLELLEISRMDAGAEHASLEVVELTDFLDGVCRSLGGPPLEVETEGPWEVHVDKRRMRQVLANLFENADRYAGGVTRVALGRTGRRLRVTVDDAGPGIPADERDRAFERFWRGAAARHQTVRGSGLGLSLVAEHVRLLGGNVSIQDAPGGGARIVVELPVPEESP